MIPEDELDANGQSVYGMTLRGDHRYDTHGSMGLEPSEDFQSDDEPSAQDHTVL